MQSACCGSQPAAYHRHSVLCTCWRVWRLGLRLDGRGGQVAAAAAAGLRHKAAGPRRQRRLWHRPRLKGSPGLGVGPPPVGVQRQPAAVAPHVLQVRPAAALTMTTQIMDSQPQLMPQRPHRPSSGGNTRCG